MADFEYVTWVSGSPVFSESLAQMSENDQHLKDLVDAMPKGILGWAESTDQVVNPTKGDKTLLTDMNLTLTIPAGRMIRACFRHKGMKNSGDVTSMIAIYIDNVQVASSLQAGRKEITAGPEEVWYLHESTGGTHTYKVKGTKVNGAAGKAARWRATEASPRQFFVEDLGAAIEPQTGA